MNLSDFSLNQLRSIVGRTVERQGQRAVITDFSLCSTCSLLQYTGRAQAVKAAIGSCIGVGLQQ